VTTALAEANVRFFFFTMATFVIGTLGVWLYFKWLNRREERKKGKLQPVAAPTPTPTGKPAEQIQTVEAARPEVTAQPSPPAETPPVAAPTTFVTPEPKSVEQAKIDTTGATKQCPACAQIIKAEARICRFCRARFEVTVKGYCMRCHAVVRVDENGKCQRCGGEVIDKHVESKWVGDREKR
jgi:hypothetical protein